MLQDYKVGSPVRCREDICLLNPADTYVSAAVRNQAQSTDIFLLCECAFEIIYKLFAIRRSGQARQAGGNIL